jgi:hypothetical protein
LLAAVRIPRHPRLLLLTNSRQERGWARPIWQRLQDAHRVCALHIDAGRKAVEIDANSFELGQQLVESSLVGHALRVRRGSHRSRVNGAWLAFNCRAALATNM